MAQAMTPNPITIALDNRAVDALREMSDRGFLRLPVLENGRILGVVSRSDFLGTEIDRLARITTCVNASADSSSTGRHKGT